MKSITERTLIGGRASIALLLSAAMALGGTPAVAFAEEGGTQPQGVQGTQPEGTQPEGTQPEGTQPEGQVQAEAGARTSTVTNQGGSVTVDSDIDVTSNYAVGTRVESGRESASLTVNGNVTATGTSDTSAVTNTSRFGKPASTEVNGNVTATSQDGRAVGVLLAFLRSPATNSTVTVSGDVEAKGSDGSTGVALQLSEGIGTLTIGGTIKSNTAITLNGSGANLVYDSTTGERTWVPNDANLDGKTVNVWKIDADTPVKAGEYIPEDKAEELVEKLTKGINYIIKYAEGQQEYFSALSADSELGSVTIQDVEYQTATEGVKITFSVPSRDGFNLAKVIGFDSGTELVRNADGTYTLTVTRGGGILLKTEWEKIEEEKPEETKPEEAKPEETKQATATTQVPLASTGSVAPSRTLSPTGDASSMAPVAMMALAGAGALVAGRRSRKE